MQIGDIVKSYDFPGNKECYMIGKVVGVFKRDGSFRAEYIGRVWCGKVDKKFKTDYFTAPLQGNGPFDSIDKDRVVVVG